MSSKARPLSDRGLRMAADEKLEIPDIRALRMRNPASELQTLNGDAQCVWTGGESRPGAFDCPIRV